MSAPRTSVPTQGCHGAPWAGACCSPTRRAMDAGEEISVILVLAAVLLVLWMLGVFAFHVTAFAIHVLLIVAVIALVMHLLDGRRSSV